MEKMREFLESRIKDLNISWEDAENLSHDEYVFLKGQLDELTTIYKAYLRLRKIDNV